MKISLQRPDDTHTVLALTGRLDLASAPDLRAAITTTIHHGAPRLIIDLGQVSFIDSSGLGALVGGLKQTRDAGGDLRIARPRPEVLDILSLMRLDRVLEPYNTLDAALTGF